MRSDRRATIADPTGPTAALERSYPGSTAPEFPAPTGSVGFQGGSVLSSAPVRAAEPASRLKSRTSRKSREPSVALDAGNDPERRGGRRGRLVEVDGSARRPALGEIQDRVACRDRLCPPLKRRRIDGARAGVLPSLDDRLEGDPPGIRPPVDAETADAARAEAALKHLHEDQEAGDPMAIPVERLAGGDLPASLVAALHEVLDDVVGIVRLRPPSCAVRRIWQIRSR